MIAITIVQIFLLVKTKFTAWPEMILWPYLINSGWLPYENIAIAHTPVLLLIVSLYNQLFGIGILQLKIFTWVSIFIIEFLLFLVTRSLWNTKIALFTLLLFPFLQIFYEGNGLWFDLFMGIFGLLTFYFSQKKYYLLAGALWFIAFLTKQTAFWFLIPILLSILVQSKKVRINAAISFFVGALTSLIISIGILHYAGILDSFLIWAVKFGITELPTSSGQIKMPGTRSLLISGFPFLAILLLGISRIKKNMILLMWVIAGTLGIFPRFELFHFQPALPFLSIALAIMFSSPLVKQKLVRYLLVVYFAGSSYLFAGFFVRTLNEGTRFYESDVENISKYISDKTQIGDTILVMNYWDNIYAHSGTLPATDPWIPQLPWYLEIPGVQDNMVQDIQNKQPKFVLQRPYPKAGPSSYVPLKLLNFVTNNYHLTDQVDGVLILEPN